jgi:carotenoid cleavage dioxygenase
MVHGVRLRGGRAEWYRNRWVRSDPVSRRLGELPIPGPRYGLCGDANANIVQHAGRVLALGEAGVLPVALDEELGSVATVDFDGTLPDGFAAHPERDPITGELFTVAYYHELPYAQYLVVDVRGRIRRCERIAVRDTPMTHAVSLTDRHLVYYDLPVTFRESLARGGSRYPYAWRPDHPARLGLLPREGSGADIRWFEVDPCFVFHPVNAYEQGDQVIVDVIRHERVFDRDLLRPGETPPMLWRWTLDPARRTVAEEQLCDVAEEFPRIDDRRRTMRHRYAYTVAMRGDTADRLAGHALCKHDLRTGQVWVRSFGPGRSAGEAVFVPRTAESAEDDGWLLTYVTDSRTGRTDLVVVDANDVTGPAAAVVHIPAPVPSGLHANWIPA